MPFTAGIFMKYKPDDIVKSCRKLESGLRLGQEGIHACQLGPFASPIYWTADEASKIKISKDMIVKKRQILFSMLNDDHSDLACKQCHMVKTKRFAEVNFSRLGHIDLAATTTCNLKCTYCGYAMLNSFAKSKYNALTILKEFSSTDIEWDSAVDFNGGEPTILPDMDEYIDYFTSRRIRIFLYTNAVKFRQSVFDGLINGAIREICTSLDAGTPSSFLHIKKRDCFYQVMENLTKYAYAGRQEGGLLSVKYIFCEDNCSDDDISGFAYAMLAIRPQRVWLTFDFEPLNNLAPDLQNLGNYDYSKHITAYVKLYKLLQKHGLTAGHFTENHLAAVSRHGEILMKRVHAGLKEDSPNNNIHDPCLSLIDPQISDKIFSKKIDLFQTNPLEKKSPGSDFSTWSILNKRVLLAPACALSKELLLNQDIKKSTLLGFLDRDPVLQGKSIAGIPVHSYEAIPKLNPEVILVAVTEYHQEEIIKTISQYINNNIDVAIYCKK